jgi:hypothetical protein
MLLKVFMDSYNKELTMENSKELEEVVVTRLLRLNAALQGIVSGVVFGAIIFVATNWLVLKGGPIGPEGEPVIGPHLSLLSQFFVGYRVSFVGSLIGFVYGAICGFCIGYFVARVYNWVLELKQSRRHSHT